MKAIAAHRPAVGATYRVPDNELSCLALGNRGHDGTFIPARTAVSESDDATPKTYFVDRRIAALALAVRPQPDERSGALVRLS
jgi:hypothetical protein